MHRPFPGCMNPLFTNVLCKNQLKNNHLTDQLMALTQVSGLYVKKIAITHSKMTVEAYFKVSEQKRILKRLWRKSGVVSQRYNITSLKNQWRKVNYVWDFKTA